jgi:hypothetical protein
MAHGPEDVPAAPDEMADTPEEATAKTAHADYEAGTPDDVADPSGNRQAGNGLPLSALRASAEEENRTKIDAATTARRQAAPSSSAVVASSPSPSKMPCGYSVTGGMTAEDNRIQAEEEKEKPFVYEEEGREEPWTNFSGIAPPLSRSR